MKTLWRTVCALDEIPPDMGVAALIGTLQVAVFRVGADDQLYAISNFDPYSCTHTVARGIVGDLNGELVVALPMYKQHIRLTDGTCVEDAETRLEVFAVRVYRGAVQVGIALTRVENPLPRRDRLVVVGTGMAAMRCLEELQRIAPERYEITMIGAEPGLPYNRILLSEVLAGGRAPADLVTHDRDWFAGEGIRLVSGVRVDAVDRSRRAVVTTTGTRVPYDRLVLATGSHALRLDVPGAALAGVSAFRTIEDVAAILEGCRPGQEVVVIGGGLLGLEAAHGLVSRGARVTVVHLATHLMERQLDPFGAGLLQQSLEERGIRFFLGTRALEYLGTERVEAVRVADGDVLKAERVVEAIGIRPNVDLARACGLACDRGIRVDDTLQTFDPAIYAIGECAEHRGRVYGLVAPLYEQATVCASQLAGAGHLRYAGSAEAAALKVAGIEVFSVGEGRVTGGREELVWRDRDRKTYRRLVLESDRLVGAQLVGDSSDGAWYRDLILKRRPLVQRDELLFGPAYASAVRAA